MWETVTAVTLLLAGADIFMMMHPAAIKTVKDVVKNLTTSASRGVHEKISDWVSSKI
jgi:acetyl-CoA decarbonylase/synthase complex subunit delta